MVGARVRIFLGGPLLPICCPPNPFTGQTLVGMDPAHLGTGYL